MECLKENGEEECGAKNYAGFLSYKKEPDMTRIARCIVANYNSGITRFGESSGVMYCKACDEKCTQKCVEARAALTPDRLNKRQNGRRFKEDGEPEFTLTTIDRHGVMMLQCPYYTGLPIKEATKKGMSWRVMGMESTCPIQTAITAEAEWENSVHRHFSLELIWEF